MSFNGRDLECYILLVVNDIEQLKYFCFYHVAAMYLVFQEKREDSSPLPPPLLSLPLRRKLSLNLAKESA